MPDSAVSRAARRSESPAGRAQPSTPAGRALRAQPGKVRGLCPAIRMPGRADAAKRRRSRRSWSEERFALWFRGSCGASTDADTRCYANDEPPHSCSRPAGRGACIDPAISAGSAPAATRPNHHHALVNQTIVARTTELLRDSITALSTRSGPNDHQYFANGVWHSPDNTGGLQHRPRHSGSGPLARNGRHRCAAPSPRDRDFRHGDLEAQREWLLR